MSATNDHGRRWQDRGYRAWTADQIRDGLNGLMQANEAQVEATGQASFVESKEYARGFKQAGEDFLAACGIRK